MPAPPLSNTFEGGSDETLITTGNSGGASGDAYDFVTAGTTTVTFDTAQPHQGTLSCRINTPASSAPVGHVEWRSLGNLTGNVYTRFYLYLQSIDSSLNYHVCQFETSGAVYVGSINVRFSNGVIQARRAGAISIAPDGTVAVTTNQWVRIETRFLPSTTAGEIEWKLFNDPESTSASDSVSYTAVDLGASSIDRVKIGISNTSVPLSKTLWIDELAVSSTGWLGPSTTFVPQIVVTGIH